MTQLEMYFFMGVALGLFLPILDALSHRIAIKLFGEFKDGL